VATRKPVRRISPAERAAYHEAGHAVAAFSLRRRFERASIVPDPATGKPGHVPFLLSQETQQTGPDVYGERRAEKRLEHAIVVHLAGMVALGILTGRRSWQGDDLDQARQLAEQRCGNGEEVGAYLRWLLVRTEDEMRFPVWWRMVESVAAELLKHREVAYAQAQWVMQAALQQPIS
jgi:ATP-dependent Zn protease